MFLDIRCCRRLRNVKRLGLYCLLHNGKMTDMDDQTTVAITCTRKQEMCRKLES